MTHVFLIVSILWIHALAVISPWPDFVVAVKNALTYGRRVWLWTAVWFGWGIAVHITYCVLWLALIISQSIMVYTVIKRLWALYLIWLGVNALLVKPQAPAPEQPELPLSDETANHRTPWQAVKEWFLTNVLNPKATLFFLWLFTMVIWPTTPWRVVLIVSVMMIVNTIVWFMLVTVIFTHAPIRRKFMQRQTTISRVIWVALVGLGVKVIDS